jgi:4-amino-4-deoxy-L-arabinose transferase-like glycosyltransferase
LKTGWKGLVNGHWSPLYPWLIAVARSILKPSEYWEFSTVHLVNFASFIAAAGAFEFFLKETRRSSGADTASTGSPLPAWALRAIAYLVFLWLSLTLITLERKSPDMLMSVFVYLALGFLLRIRRDGGSWISFALLGVVLGLGYLAKAPMFPLAIVILCVALLAGGKPIKVLPGIIVALLLFSAISAPLVTELSRSKHHFTFGESGKWNYLVEINGAGPVWYMQDVGSAKGRFIHPPQKIADSPAAYAFLGPVGGTLPAWYDPSYWIEGAEPHLDRHRQLVKLLKNLGACFDLVFNHEGALLAVFAVLFLVGQKRIATLIVRQWPVWVPALAALGMYAIVLVQERYVAVFLIVLWTTLFSSLRFSSTSNVRTIALGAVLALSFTLGTPMLLAAGTDLYNSVLHRQRHEQWIMAQQLRELGMHPGDLVARVGGLHRVEWARLLQVRVIAEVPRDEAENFWSADRQVQTMVIQSFRKAGASAIVAEQIPPAEIFSPQPQWRKIGNGNFYVYFIRP